MRRKKEEREEEKAEKKERNRKGEKKARVTGRSYFVVVGRYRLDGTHESFALGRMSPLPLPLQCMESPGGGFPGRAAVLVFEPSPGRGVRTACAKCLGKSMDSWLRKGEGCSGFVVGCLTCPWLRSGTWLRLLGTWEEMALTVRVSQRRQTAML